MAVEILGVKVDTLTKDQALNKMIQAATDLRKSIVVTVNPEFIIAAQANQQFKDILNQAELAVADGVGVLWAANLIHYQPKLSRTIRGVEIWVVAIIYGLTTLIWPRFRVKTIPAKMSGADLVYDLAELSEKSQLKLFLLGSKEGIAAQAAAHLQQKYPQLLISGTFAGDGSEAGDAEATAYLAQHPADILLVAYGAPKQELWMARNLSSVPASVAIGLGGTFRFLAGDIRRAPSFVQAIGLEWLFRLIQEPWRWRRQLVLPKFVLAVIQSKIKTPV